MNDVTQQPQLDSTAILAGLAALLTNNAAPGAITDPTIAAATHSPEVVAQQKVREGSLRAAAVDIAKDLVEIFDGFGEDGFDAEVIVQMSSGIAYRARDQHFWSRNQSDYQASLLAKQQEVGAHFSDQMGGGEINELENVENKISFHNRNMEQYEIMLYVAEALWQYYSQVLTTAGVEITYVPDFRIGEAEFASYVDAQMRRRQATGRANRQATSAAHHMTRSTTCHFLSAPAETEPEEQADGNGQTAGEAAASDAA